MPTEDSAQRLSYKFQRLRERLRAAIASGELSGKLPGERLLAQQFNVNAKTLSKALTDLAAEGLLDRTIGRGTFVRGSGGDDAAAAPRAVGRWLLLCQSDCEADPICRELHALNGECETLSDLSAMRPSLVNPFSAVVDVHGSLPDAMLRDLLLRSRRLVQIDVTPRFFATHAVMIDRAAAIGLLVRDLLRGRFARIVVVDDAPGEAFDAARATARRLGDDSIVASATPGDFPGVGPLPADVAFIGASPAIAADLLARFAAVGVRAPDDVSIACIGVVDPDRPGTCSGYAVTATQVAQTVAQLIAEPQLNRPTTLWLVGNYLDRGTVRGDATSAA